MSFYKILPVGAVLFVAGCASIPADRGLGEVSDLVGKRGGGTILAPGADTRSQVADWLSKPLTADTAVAIALVRNPQIRLQYARLGLAQADVLQASRLSNPTLSVAVLSSNKPGDQARLDYGLVQNFTDLLVLSAKTKLATAGVQRAKQSAAAAILDLAAEVAGAFYRAVGAEQVAQMREVVAKSAESSGQLAKRFYDAGNLNELEWRREQASGTQARLEADAAHAEASQAHIELNRLLGLREGEDTWTLKAELPTPVMEEEELASLQKIATSARLDLAAKRSEVAQFGQVRSLASKLRWLGIVDVGVQGERDNDGTHLIGPSFSLQLPIFNQGTASLARIDALGEQIGAELDLLEADIGNSVATTYARMLAARDRSQRHLTELIPQREAVVARSQELQNYMLIGQFELLAAKRDEYEAYQSYLESVRDYWLARVDLARAVGAKLPSDARIGDSTAAAIRLPDKAPAMNMHGGHSMGGIPGMQMKPGETMNDMPGMDMKPGEEMPGMNHGQMHQPQKKPGPDRAVPKRGSQPEVQEAPREPH